MVRIPSGAGRIGRDSFRSEKDCSQFLEEQVRLARIPLNVVNIGQISLEGSWDWSEGLREWVGLVRIPSGAREIGPIPSGKCGIGQNVFRSSRDWLKVFWQWPGVE